MGRPKAPGTSAFQVRILTEDYNCLKRCWKRNNLDNLSTFASWLRNELHKLAEERRGVGSDTGRFPPVMMSEECGAAAVDAAGALAAILEIDVEKAADLLRRKRVLWRNVDKPSG
jgi:hypothetical protein